MVIANDVINLQDQPGAVSQLAKIDNLPKNLFKKGGKGFEDFLTSKFGQGLISLLSLNPGLIGQIARNIGVPLALTAEQNKKQQAAKDESEALFTQAEGEVTSNRINIQSLLASLSGDVQGRLTADKNRLTGLLEGLGETERGDINRQFTEFSADETSRLQERGLGSTSVVSGVRGGIEERRTRSLAGLKERLRNARLGIESSFAQQSTSAAERLGLAGINFQDKNTADLVNLLASKQIIGPDTNSFLGLQSGLGGASVPKANLPPGIDPATIALLAATVFTGGAAAPLLFAPTAGLGTALAVGGSDVNTKHDIREIDTEEIAKELDNLPVYRWKYIDDEQQLEHIGPMAQDFNKAFGTGDHEKRTIAFLDMFGVLVASVQKLSAEIKQLKLAKEV